MSTPDDPFDFADDEAAAAPPARPHAPAAWLDGLNPEQRRAVETLDGPVLVLAGAGTGKTRVLTTRLAHVLATHRAFPGQILAVTFTNKAAREMKTRIGALIGGAVEGMQWLGTFHSIGARMLRRHAELAGLRSNFTILDADDQLRLMKQVIEAARIDEKRWPARALAAEIDGWKNKGLMPGDLPSGLETAYADGRAPELYGAYQQRLRDLNAADFGDLIVAPLHILRENAEVLAEYRRRFRYMLVDEYQDTNVAQYLWLRLIAGERGNLCCVGDDDQSIYGWRGAEVDNILRFERDFPGATVIRLERNYRSTPNILGAASGLIAANQARLGKTLWTEGDPGDKVRVRGVWDAEEEARQIAAEIEALGNDGVSFDEVAILVRMAAQMREFEERFVTVGLPYRVIGGPRFYERLEIRDAIAYLRLVAQGDDDLAFERIVNQPKRGLGATSVQAIHAHARAERLPLLMAAERLVAAEGLKPAARRSLGQFAGDVRRWQEAAKALPHVELAELVLDESGYTQMWLNDKSAEAPGRLDNLKELVRSMGEFENLQGFLEHVSLVMDVEQAESGPKVSLMTLHAAKGLEFDIVFLPGWEEGLFPSQRALDEGGLASLEEERRLAYVGLTRARRRAVISYAANRRIYGSWTAAIPSRFVEELPQAHVEAEQDFGTYGGFMYGGFADRSRFDEGAFAASSYGSPGWKRAEARRAAGAERPRPPTIEGEAELIASSAPSAARFKPGERVFHQKFGYGHVRAADGAKLTVEFEHTGEKHIVASFLEKA